MAEDFVRTYQIKIEANDSVGAPLFKRATIEGAEWIEYTKKVIVPGSLVTNQVVDIPPGDLLIVKTTGSLIVRLDSLITETFSVTKFAIIDHAFTTIDITQIHDDGGSIVEFTSLKKV